MWFQSSLGPFTETGSVVPSGMEYPVKFRPIPTEFCGYWDPPGRIRHCRAGFRRGVRPCPGDTEPAGWIVTGFGTFRALTRRVGAEVGRSWPDLCPLAGGIMAWSLGAYITGLTAAAIIGRLAYSKGNPPF